MTETTITFTHPSLGVVSSDTGLNEITWDYGLNFQTFPTLGGEVVQILSYYIDDLQIVGDVRTVAKMEEIYSFFSQYFLVVNPQADHPGVFVGEPITMRYSARNWTMDIRPVSLPQMRYGRDVVAPQWRLTAAVVETNSEVRDTTINQASADLTQLDVDAMTTLGHFQGQIGFIPGDPFQVPETDVTKATLDAQLGKLADQFNQLVSAYGSGDFSSLHANYSKPAFLAGGTGDPSQSIGNGSVAAT